MKKILLLALFSSIVFSKDIEVVSKYCKINWTQNFIECKGESAQNQQKYQAVRSSEIIAKKNLLEFVKGIKLTSEMTVDSAMKVHNSILESISGTIRGAQVLDSIYNRNDGSATATVRLSLGKDILKDILDNPQIKLSLDRFSLFKLYADTLYYSNELETLQKLYEDLKSKDQSNLSLVEYVDTIIQNLKANTNSSGIIIDATDVSDFEIAAIPKIRDENGNEIYPKNMVSKNMILKKNGVVCYEMILSDAQKNERVASTPLVIKAKGIYGKNQVI